MDVAAGSCSDFNFVVDYCYTYYNMFKQKCKTNKTPLVGIT